MLYTCSLTLVLLCLEQCSTKETLFFTSDQYSLTWQVFKHDIATNTTTQITDMGAQNFNPSISPNGDEIGFVSERDLNYDLYTMNAHTLSNTTRRTFAVPYADHHMAFAPDYSATGTFAFVSSRDWSFDSAAGVYVLSAGTVTRISPKYASDISPTWSPDGKWIFVAHSELETNVVGNLLFLSMAFEFWHQTIVRMRPDGSERGTIVVDAGWPAFGSDPNILYFHKFDTDTATWGIFSMDLSAKKWEPKRLSPPGVHALTPSVQTRGVFSARLPLISMAVYNPTHKNRQVAVMYADGSGYRTITDIANCAAADYNPVISPDGTYVLFNRGGWPTSKKSLTPNLRQYASPREDMDMYMVNGAFPHLNKERTKIAVTYQCANKPRFCNVHTMNIDGSDRRVTVKHPGAWMTSWSGEGKIAWSTGGAFESAFKKDCQVGVVYPNGTGEDYITSYEKTHAANGYAVYSPDYSTIVYRSGEGSDVRMEGPAAATAGNRSLWLMNHDGSNKRQLTFPVANSADNLPEWSPDGRKLVFSSNRGHVERMGIWTVNTDGTDLREIYYSHWGDSAHPSFSTDGQRVVFVTSSKGLMFDAMTFPFKFQSTHELFMMRPDGSELTRLTHDFITDTHPLFYDINNMPPLSEEGYGIQNGCEVPYPDPITIFDPKTKLSSKGRKTLGGCPMNMERMLKELKDDED